MSIFIHLYIMNTDKHTVTFVSAYVKVYEREYEDWRGLDGRLEYFRSLLALGIPLCIFVDRNCEPVFSELEQTYPNLKVMEYMTLAELPVTQQVSKMSLNLPRFRNELKDTTEYMCMILSKSEFVKRVIERNPFQTNYVCWIDFSLPYVFKHAEQTLHKLKTLSMYPFTERTVYIPGCHPPRERSPESVEHGLTYIDWRFCGGIIFGDITSMRIFCDTHERGLASFLETYKTLIWEVNYWSWLELMGYIHPTWVRANHDDSIINIPMV